MKTCATCIHLGELKHTGEDICLAAITTEPPVNGTTRTKYPFVYKTQKTSTCEMHTEEQL